jgi:hypothetical protein
VCVDKGYDCSSSKRNKVLNIVSLNLAVFVTLYYVFVSRAFTGVCQSSEMLESRSEFRLL